MRSMFFALISAFLVVAHAQGSELSDSIKLDYDSYLAELWDHFHRVLPLMHKIVVHETCMSGCVYQGKEI